jgi:hypothetical protein
VLARASVAVSVARIGNILLGGEAQSTAELEGKKTAETP